MNIKNWIGRTKSSNKPRKEPVMLLPKKIIYKPWWLKYIPKRYRKRKERRLLKEAFKFFESQEIRWIETTGKKVKKKNG